MGIRDQIKKQKNSYRSTSIRGQIQEMRQQEEALKTWAPQGIGDLKQAESKIPAEPKKSFAQEALYDVGVRPGAFFRGAAMNDQRRRAQGKDLYSLDAIKEGFNAGVNAFKNPEVATGENVVRGWGWEKSGPSLPVVGTPRQFVGGLLEMGSEPLNIVTGAAGGALATKVLPGLAKSASLLPRIGANVAKGAVEGSLVGGVDAYAKNRSIAQGAVTGAIGGGAIRGVLGAFSKGETPNSLPPRNETPIVDAEIIKPRVKTDFVGDQFGNVGRPIGGLIADSNAPKLALPPGRFRVNTDFVGDELGNVGRPNAGLLPEGADAIAQREFAKGLQPKNKLLPEVRKPMQLPVGESPINRSPGTMRPSNTPLKQALERYNEAIEDIQNYFGTHELRGDEVARIKPELGIDLDGLVKDIEAAEKGVNLKDMAERSRMAEVAGVKEPAKVNTITSGKYYSKLDELETAARQRIASRRGRLNSGVPIDDIADYALIGAAKMGKGAIRFSQWSAEMVAEHGEHIKPYLKDIYAKAKELHGRFKSGDPEAVNIMGGMKEQPKTGNVTAKPKVTTSNKAVDEIGLNTEAWKDKSRLFYTREIMERNIEDIAGKDAPKVIDDYFTTVKNADADRLRFLNAERDSIKTLGIKGRTKDSELVQKYGEGLISEEELKTESPKNWDKIKNAANVLRGKYDRYLDQINEALVEHGYDPIPKRKDYFAHFQEITDMLEAFGVPKQDNALPTGINGLTENFKPGKNFFTHAMKRTGNDTTYDAIQGIDRYLDGASKLIYHTKNIKNLRKLEQHIREKHGNSDHLSNFVVELEEYTNILAGKKSKGDRAAEFYVGRRMYGAVDRLKRQVGSNMIGYNAGAMLTQFIPVTHSLATTSKTAFVKGMMETIGSAFKDDGFVNKSTFLTRRNGSDRLVMNAWDKAAETGFWLFKVVDNFVSQTVVRGKYLEGLEKGLSKERALKVADDWASRMMADRGLGGQPTMFNSKTLGVLTQFQLEVNNQLSFIFKDIPRVNGGYFTKGTAAMLGQLFVYGYLFNNLFESATGRRPSFDPIGVAVKAVEDYKNVDNKKATKNLVKNVADQLPFASLITGGGRIPITNAIPDLIGLATGETTLKKEAIKLGSSAILPTGGNQIRKSIQGLMAIRDKGVYNDGEDKFMYPVKPSLPNVARGALFGKNSFPEAQEYYNKDRRPLGLDQTKALEAWKQQGNDPVKLYNIIQKQREIEKLAEQLKAIAQDKALSTEIRNSKINDLRKSIEKKASEIKY